jgi:beta-galactosidase
MRDFATVYINNKRVGVLDRRLKQDSLEISSTEPNATLSILVENNGRINYGPYLIDNRQGITQKVTLNDTELTGWQMYKFPFKTVNGFKFSPLPTIRPGVRELFTVTPSMNTPMLYKGTFTLNQTGDTFLDMHGFGKGFVFINGHNLGKYWYIGPQQTLYIPASWLRKGVNEIDVFDELKAFHSSISTLDHPVLNEVVKGE